MNKLLKEFCEYKGLKVEKNSAYGVINNIEINVSYSALDSAAPVLIHFSFYGSDNDKRLISNMIAAERIKFLKIGADAYGISVGLNDITLGKLVKRLDSIIETVVKCIKSYDVKLSEYCPLCGNELTNECKIYNVDGFSFKLDESCVSNINAVIEEENKDFDDSPNNYGKGLIGILLGALVGSIAYVILFMIGFISAICAFISIMLGVFLYKKFGGKQNAVMVVMAGIVTLLSLVGTLFVLYILAATGLSLEAGLNIVGIEAFTFFMNDNAFATEFISNLAMTILFIVLGAGYEVTRLFKSVKRTEKIK